MTADGRKAIQSDPGEAIHPTVRDFSATGFFAVQRNATGPSAHCTVGSMSVRAHLLGNPAFLQAVLGEPGVGTLDRTLDMLGGPREIIRRSDQRT